MTSSRKAREEAEAFKAQKVRNNESQRRRVEKEKDVYTVIMEAAKEENNYSKKEWLGLLQKGMPASYKKLTKYKDLSEQKARELIKSSVGHREQEEDNPRAEAQRKTRSSQNQARDEVFIHIYLACQQNDESEQSNEESEDEFPLLDFDFLRKWTRQMKYSTMVLPGVKRKKPSSSLKDESDEDYIERKPVSDTGPVRRSSRPPKIRKIHESKDAIPLKAELESDLELNNSGSDTDSQSVSTPQPEMKPELAAQDIQPTLTQDAFIKFLQRNPIMLSAYLFTQFGKFPGLSEEMKKLALASVIQNPNKIIPAILQEVELIQNQDPQSSTEELQTVLNQQPLAESVQEVFEEAQRQNAMLPVAPFNPDSLLADAATDSKMDTSSNENSFAGLPSALGFFSRPVSPLLSPSSSKSDIFLEEDAETVFGLR